MGHDGSLGNCTSRTRAAEVGFTRSNTPMPRLIFEVVLALTKTFVTRFQRCSVCPEMSNKIALVSLDFAGTGSMCGGSKGVGGDGCATSRNNNQDLSDRNPPPARQGRGNRTRSGRLRGSRVSREGPRSRTRHGATSVRGNNAAECRKPDQPDQSTKLSGHSLSLLPAG